MYTERAKNAVIVILILLNATVFLLNWNRNMESNRIPEKRESAIRTVLNNNNITLDSALEGKLLDFSPKKVLETSEFNFPVLEEMLLGTGEVQETLGFDATVKVSDRGRITIRENMLSFQAADQKESTMSDPEQIDPIRAKAVTDDFIAAITEKAGLEYGFTYVYTQSVGNRYIVFYLGECRGGILASNTMLFTVDSRGITQFSCSLVKPGGFIGAEREACSVDEALYTLGRELPDIYPGGNITITSIDRVYYLDERSGGAEASPHYMFTVRQDSWNPDRQDRHLVDAYTNAYN